MPVNPISEKIIARIKTSYIDKGRLFCYTMTERTCVTQRSKCQDNNLADKSGILINKKYECRGNEKWHVLKKW